MKKYRVTYTLRFDYDVEAADKEKAIESTQPRLFNDLYEYQSQEIYQDVKVKDLSPSQKRMVKKPYEQNAYEVWRSIDGSWTWYVLKKYQNPEHEEKNEYARWFCLVKSPFVPKGELGDVYVKDIKANARRVR